MLELIIGLIILLLGIPLGSFLAKLTKEELGEGQKWFRIVIIFGVVGTIISLYLRNDYLLFTSLFIIIVTSRSLRKRV